MLLAGLVDEYMAISSALFSRRKKDVMMDDESLFILVTSRTERKGLECKRVAFDVSALRALSCILSCHGTHFNTSPPPDFVPALSRTLIQMSNNLDNYHHDEDCNEQECQQYEAHQRSISLPCEAILSDGALGVDDSGFGLSGPGHGWPGW